MNAASEQPTAVIIGGGVIGAACAYYLAKVGYRPIVIDKGKYAGACSHGNCGYVCPSHVLPLAEPGAIQSSLKAMFKRNSPFAIKPRLDLALWSWMWHFATRCNERDMLESGHGIQPLLESSLKLYTELIEQDGVACEWQKRGLLYAYRNRDLFEKYSATNQLLTDVFHEPAEKLTGEQLSELEPALKPGLAGGWFYPHDAHLRPDVLMDSWRTRLEGMGAVFHEDCNFHNFTGINGRVTAAKTTVGELTADLFIVATGALTPFLSEQLGCRIPIQPGKGYSLTMPRPTICPKIPLIFPEHRVAVTPMETGYRLGSIMEFAGYDASIKPERIALLRDGAKIYLREPTASPELEQWTGWRPMTYDSRPIIDRSPCWENVYIAAGHNMLGLSMATATGKLISELATTRTPHVDPKPYSVQRFR